MMQAISDAELSAIKEALCRHFNLTVERSKLKFRQKNMLALRGNNNRHYDFVIQDNDWRYRAFGKISPHTDREYRNLQYMVKKLPEKEMHLPRPIALVNVSNRPMLLQECLEGYSHIFSSRRLRYYLPGRAAAIENIGKTVLDTIYVIQRQFPFSFSPLSEKDAEGIPNQPKSISVYEQLDAMRSLSSDTKKKLKAKLHAILENDTWARRGLIHGDLGMRNVMAIDSSLTFIDWDYMQEKGFSLLDPIYFITILLMRSLQIFVLQEKVTSLGIKLTQYVKLREMDIVGADNTKFVDDSIWFGMCLSFIDTLWWYEKDLNNGGKVILKRRNRQINYLASALEREAMNGHD